MTITRIRNWPFPEGIDSWEGLQKYLELLYIALGEESAMSIYDDSTQMQNETTNNIGGAKVATINGGTKIDIGTITADRLSFTAYDTALNDLDDIADGTTYAKVLNADITAGHVLLSATTGDLDDIANGATYGKVALTGITAGKIIVAGLDSGVTVRMFLDSTTKTNIEAWRHASDVTLIDGGDIYTGSITATQIAAGTITATEIATDAITTIKIVANAVTAAKIATDTITATQIAAGTITAIEIATGTMTADKLIVGTTANTEETLDVWQGEGDAQIFRLRSTSIAHDITQGGGQGYDWGTWGDCYFYMRKFDAEAGGMHCASFTEANLDISFQLYAVYGAASTAKDGTATGAINLAGLRADPTNHTYQDCLANENIFCIKTKPTAGAYQAIFIVDEDGDVLYDGATTAFQNEDDIQLLKDLEDTLSDKIPKIKMKQKDVFKKHKVVHVNEWKDEESKKDMLSRFVSTKKLNMLLMGSIRQLNDKITQLEARI